MQTVPTFLNNLATEIGQKNPGKVGFSSGIDLEKIFSKINQDKGTKADFTKILQQACGEKDVKDSILESKGQTKKDKDFQKDIIALALMLARLQAAEERNLSSFSSLENPNQGSNTVKETEGTKTYQALESLLNKALGKNSAEQVSKQLERILGKLNSGKHVSEMQNKKEVIELASFLNEGKNKNAKKQDIAGKELSQLRQVITNSDSISEKAENIGSKDLQFAKNILKSNQNQGQDFFQAVFKGNSLADKLNLEQNKQMLEVLNVQNRYKQSSELRQSEIVKNSSPYWSQVSSNNQISPLANLSLQSITRSSSNSQIFRQQVVDQVVNHLSKGINKGNNVLKIRMHPPELGTLQLKIVTEDGKMSAYFQTQSHQVQEILERNMFRLRDAMQQQGLDIADMKVSVDSGSGSGFEDFEREQELPPYLQRPGWALKHDKTEVSSDMERRLYAGQNNISLRV